jgi:hypothetical protein
MFKLKLLAACSVLVLALPASAGQVLVNGGFETGDTAGWISADSPLGSGSFFVTGDSAAPLNPFLPAAGPAGGSFYAVSDQSSGPSGELLNGQHALYQTFTVPLGVMLSVLSFDMFVNDWSVAFAGSPLPNDGGRADLLNAGVDPLTGSAIGTFYSSDNLVVDSNPNPWVHTSVDVTALLIPGQSYTIRFLESDSTSFVNVGLDNVSLDVTSAVPEPGTPVLLSGPVIGLMIIKLRKSRRNQ